MIINHAKSPFRSCHVRNSGTDYIVMNQHIGLNGPARHFSGQSEAAEAECGSRVHIELPCKVWNYSKIVADSRDRKIVLLGEVAYDALGMGKISLAALLPYRIRRRENRIGIDTICIGGVRDGNDLVCIVERLERERQVLDQSSGLEIEAVFHQH